MPQTREMAGGIQRWWGEYKSGIGIATFPFHSLLTFATPIARNSTFFQPFQHSQGHLSLCKNGQWTTIYQEEFEISLLL